VALSIAEASRHDSLHVAVIERVGEAMESWDSPTRGGSWTPDRTAEERKDLPPLRFGEHAGSPKTDDM